MEPHAGGGRAAVRAGLFLHERARGRRNLQPPPDHAAGPRFRAAEFPVGITAAEKAGHFQCPVLGHQVKVEFLGQFDGVDDPIELCLMRIIEREVFLLHEGRDRHAVGNLATQSRQQSFARSHAVARGSDRWWRHTDGERRVMRSIAQVNFSGSNRGVRTCMTARAQR